MLSKHRGKVEAVPYTGMTIEIRGFNFVLLFKFIFYLFIIKIPNKIFVAYEQYPRSLKTFL